MVNQTDIWIEADWPVPARVHAGTTLRTGGVSQTPYASLNLAAHVDDCAAHVQQNRERVMDALALPAMPLWLKQVHGKHIVAADSSQPDAISADGSFTDINQRVCAVLTADCVPLLFCDRDGRRLAAIHAGWRGICLGIIEHAVALYPEAENLRVWIGPCIHQEHYEVGKEVFMASQAYAANTARAFEQTGPAHWQCDLVQLTRICLNNAGVFDIYDCDCCTYGNEERFYSYRRDGITGRTASLIWMD